MVPAPLILSSSSLLPLTPSPSPAITGPKFFSFSEQDILNYSETRESYRVPSDLEIDLLQPKFRVLPVENSQILSRRITKPKKKPKQLSETKLQTVKKIFQKRHPEIEKFEMQEMRVRKVANQMSRRSLDLENSEHRNFHLKSQNLVDDSNFKIKPQEIFNKNGFNLKIRKNGQIRGHRNQATAISLVQLAVNLVAFRIDPPSPTDLQTKNGKATKIQAPKYLNLNKRGQVYISKYLNEESIFYSKFNKNHYYSYVSIRHHKNFKDCKLGMNKRGRMKGYCSKNFVKFNDVSFLPVDLL